MEDNSTYVFETPRSQTLQAVLFFFGGLGLFVIAFVILTISGLAESKSTSTPIAHLFPAIFGAGLIGTSLFKICHSQRLSLTREGVTIDAALGRQFVPWASLRHVRSSSATSTMGHSTMPVLDLFDVDGQLITRVGGKVSDFGRLYALINSAIAVTHPESPDEMWIGRAMRRAGRGQRRFLYALCLPIGLAFLFGGFWGVHEGMKNRRFATEGVIVDAKIEKHFMKSVTPYVAYAFTDASGAIHRRESMMDKMAWMLLDGQDTVSVQYLKGDPEWNTLVAGSGESNFGFGMAAMCFGLSTFLLGSVVFLASGWDLNSTNGVTRLTRHGVTVRAWGKPKAPSDRPMYPGFHLEALPAQAAPAERLPPGLTLLAVGVGTLGAMLLVLNGLGIALFALAVQQTGAGGAAEFALYAAGVLAGLLDVVACVGVLRAWTSGWWLGIFGMVVTFAFSAWRLTDHIYAMATLPDLPGQAGFAVRMGLITGALIDVVMLACGIAVIGLLARRIVRTQWPPTAGRIATA